MRPFQSYHAVGVDFTGIVWFNWVGMAFNFNDDATSNEVTHSVAIPSKVIEVPSFGERFGE